MSTVLLRCDHRNRGEAKNKPPLFGVSQMGAPQGGLSCPFGAIHLQVARHSRVGGGFFPLSRLPPTAPPSLTGQGSLEYFFLLAEDEGFDLIKVSPPSRPAASGSPPDCRIFDRSNPHIRIKQNSPSFRMSCFVLAEDEGFEPPRTESESGVLPLH